MNRKKERAQLFLLYSCACLLARSLLLLHNCSLSLSFSHFLTHRHTHNGYFAAPKDKRMGRCPRDGRSGSFPKEKVTQKGLTFLSAGCTARNIWALKQRYLHYRPTGQGSVFSVRGARPLDRPAFPTGAVLGKLAVALLMRCRWMTMLLCCASCVRVLCIDLEQKFSLVFFFLWRYGNRKRISNVGS